MAWTMALARANAALLTRGRAAVELPLRRCLATLPGAAAAAPWSSSAAPTRRVFVGAAATAAAAAAAAAAGSHQRCCCAPKVSAERAAELERKSRELMVAAEAGDADALCEVGLVLLSNAVRKTSQAAAFGYLRQAAQQRHPKALWALGSCHQLGIGTKKDIGAAVSCRPLQACNGRPAERPVQTFSRSDISDRDVPAEQVRCFSEAAELGVHECQHTLGMIFSTGEVCKFSSRLVHFRSVGVRFRSVWG